MTRTQWLQSLALTSLGLTACSVQAQVAPAPGTVPGQVIPAQPGQVVPGQVVPGQVVPAQPGQVIRPGQAVPGRPVGAPVAGQPRRMRHEIDLPGPIDSPQDVRDTLRMAFMMADTDHDGRLSQREVTDAANMLVGGIFFAADANGDGVLTREEAQQVRQRISTEYPALRAAMQRARAEKQGDKAEGGSQPLRALANMLDADNDQQIKASELRQAVSSVVQTAFQAVDTNRDNQLSPGELNAAAIGLAQAAMQAAFQQADADNNGSLSRDEFDKALVEPGHTIFAMLDANQDGQLSREELDRAGDLIIRRAQMIRIPRDGGTAPLLGTARVPDQNGRADRDNQRDDPSDSDKK